TGSCEAGEAEPKSCAHPARCDALPPTSPGRSGYGGTVRKRPTRVPAGAAARRPRTTLGPQLRSAHDGSLRCAGVLRRQCAPCGHRPSGAALLLLTVRPFLVLLATIVQSCRYKFRERLDRLACFGSGERAEQELPM